MTVSNFPDVQDYTPDHPSLLRSMILVVKNLMQGRSNNTGNVTLTANSATSTVQVPKEKFGQNTLVVLIPQTANAAAEFGAGSLYVSARDLSLDPPTFTLTHVNNAQTDRIFGYFFIG